MSLGIVAHVGYVTDEQPSRDPIGFLLAALGNPLAIGLLVAGAAVVLGALAAWVWLRPLAAAREAFVARAATYRPSVPWMLRLATGLVLIGSGLNRVVFSPTLAVPDWPYLLLTAVGFLLLLGFAVRAAALVGLALYAVALALDPSLIGMWDLAGGLGAVVLIGPGAPSLDDLLRASFPRAWGGRLATIAPSSERYEDLIPLLVRIGLGGAFAASGIVDKLLIYERALAAVDNYHLTGIVPVAPELWVVGAFAVETALGLAILAGIFTRLAAMVGFAVLTLTLFALPDDPVIAHVGLFGLSSVLVVLGAGRWSVDRALRLPAL